MFTACSFKRLRLTIHVLLLSALLAIPLTTAHAQSLVNTTPFIFGQMYMEGPCTGIGEQHTILYCNGDGVYHTNHGFTNVPGRYRIDILGASTTTNVAQVDVFVDNVKVGTASWQGTNNDVKTVSFDVTSGGANKEVAFRLSTDVGNSDTRINQYSLYYEGTSQTPQDPPPPTLPSSGAAFTGDYRNLFAEWGQSQSAIQSKVDEAYREIFTENGSSNTRLYYEVDSDKAYILDVFNNDIRTEGMSYGMIIAVQMNDQVRFNKLWNFAKTYMQCPNANFDCGTPGQRDGYFAWQIDPNTFQPIDKNPAPDGEVYYATALLFAAGRWGNGSGIYNYYAEAQTILDAMLVDNRPNSFRSLFNLSNKLIIFSPNNQSANYVDPSYHTPAFFEFWARHDRKASNRAFWADAAVASRNYWTDVIGNRTNGLMPDCTDFNGTPIPNCASGVIYAYDSWRTISNVAIDYAWWKGDSNGAPLNSQVTWSNQLQEFFGAKRPEYINRWNLDGTPFGSDTNSPGHIAMNAVAGLAGTTPRVWEFTSDVWELPIPSGQFRYYDGCLYMLSLLHLSGNFRMYEPGNVSTMSMQTDIDNTNLYVNSNR